MSRHTFFTFVVLLVTVTSGIAIYNDGESRIVGGNAVSPGEFPYQAALLLDGRLTCGCVVISNDSVVTAAHCVYNKNLTSFSIKAGSTSLSSNESSTHLVLEAIIHEDYSNVQYFPNDIAVLKVSPNFTYSASLQPAVLPKQGHEYPDGLSAFALGWGSTYTGSPYPDELQSTTLFLVSFVDCFVVYVNGIYSYHICADSLLPLIPRGTCSGDSGGALEVNGELAGIASWQHVPCGQDGYPSVFTKVALFSNWIRNAAGIQ